MPHGDPHQLESLWLRAGGYQMHARVARNAASSAPPVVLVHGLGVSSRYMVPTARLLMRDYSVFAPDLPGFGKSERPRRILTVEDSAEALLAWMEAADLDRAALLGNSLGCQVIAEAAVRQPERVTRAVLIAPTMDPYAPSAWHHVFRLALDAFYESPLLVFIAGWDYFTAGPIRMWRTFRYAVEDRLAEDLPRMACPTLVVRGGNDPIVSQRWAEEATALLPHGRLAVIPDAPHAVNYSTPEELMRVVRPFLEEERRADALTRASESS